MCYLVSLFLPLMPFQLPVISMSISVIWIPMSMLFASYDMKQITMRPELWIILISCWVLYKELRNLQNHLICILWTIKILLQLFIAPKKLMNIHSHYNFVIPEHFQDVERINSYFISIFTKRDGVCSCQFYNNNVLHIVIIPFLFEWWKLMIFEKFLVKLKRILWELMYYITNVKLLFSGI